MRLMGIDYGTKRVGIALSDDKGMMAFPHSVIPNDGTLLKSIEKIVLEEKVEKIVIGHSLGREGTPNAVHAKVEEFIQDLTLNIGLPIELEPEQYTTQEAIRFQGRTDMTDAAAASVILNSYIMRIQNTKKHD
ncbi:MAG: Holliday junction resolvase RuvX [Candidatus Pacebacteria bacterium]|nr:Holliday junction resolvase RuvX [Candidatus Paceibacterota bacterium]MCF7857635.1 Holliday junction resolvase RuvX [Candidatus Paceibacterota bacterium]